MSALKYSITGDGSYVVTDESDRLCGMGPTAAKAEEDFWQQFSALMESVTDEQLGQVPVKTYDLNSPDAPLIYLEGLLVQCHEPNGGEIIISDHKDRILLQNFIQYPLFQLHLPISYRMPLIITAKKL